ncbi:FAD-binding protein [Brevibacterium sp. 5221]|uniref:FAD-binding protein n=1 Tax=Brevibacterium rongguiense TaxID=2695267 RepID=A0A6N9H9G2_9MICO|nr:FAD-dependent oxidoreductase [Brevibacterium rongguiense]MYM20688.1 FAD-binding protein [Brevibacterium rongguiense]
MRALDFDAVVVGAGPAGSTAAAHLAAAGLSVALLEKSAFPRDKVCGDALTPRAVRELQLLGIDPREEDGWHRNRGLRLIGAGHRLEMDWPAVDGMPDFGLTRARTGLDAALADHARASGAELFEHTFAQEPVLGADGGVTGVRAVATDSRGRKTGDETLFRAPVVIASDGVSARMAVGLGIEKRADRPMGVAVRTYYSSPRASDDRLESWLELRAPAQAPAGDAAGAGRARRPREGERGEAMPGYGWLFPMGDGTVNVGLGILDSSPQFGTVDYRGVLREWIAAMGHEWSIGEDTMVAKVRSAALPMAFNRTPHLRAGVLLVGDSAGMVNPFNGEGIDYAMESARLAAEAVSTVRRYPRAAMHAALREYPDRVRGAFGSYFTLGRIFASLIGRPALMSAGLKYGMGSETLMRFVVKLLANLYRGGESDERDLYDRIIVALETLVPATDNRDR